jgi:hypothetical protein
LDDARLAEIFGREVLALLGQKWRLARRGLGSDGPGRLTPPSAPAWGG